MIRNLPLSYKLLRFKHSRGFNFFLKEVFLLFSPNAPFVGASDIGQAPTLFPIASLLSYWDSITNKTTILCVQYLCPCIQQLFMSNSFGPVQDQTKIQDYD